MLVRLRMLASGLIGLCAFLVAAPCVQALSAEPVNAVGIEHMASPFGDTLAELRINDPRWVDRIINNFAAGISIDPAVLRTDVARCLFRCRSFDGIDLSRPALLAWRKGPAPLMAIIPLTDRRAFLESFGTSLGDDGPLIRIGERDGTLVYSQNGNDGLIEYRLEVNDSAAFLARDAKECRALRAYMPARITGDAPLVLHASSAFLVHMTDPATQVANYLQLPGDPSMALRFIAYQAMKRGWEAMVPQLSEVSVELRPQGENDIRVVTDLHAQADSNLGVWIGNQRNLPNRLLGLVRLPTSALCLSGCIAWQGQHVGEIGAQILKAQFASRWNTSADELWRSIWAMLERCGPFAAACDVDVSNGQVNSEWRMIAEQPRAYDLVGVFNTFVQTLTGSPGDALTLPGASGFRQPASALLSTSPADLVSLASDHAFAASLSTTHDAEKVASDLLQRSTAVLPADDAKCVVALTVNATPIINVLVQLYGGLALIAPADVQMPCVMSSAADANLIIETSLPLHGLAKVMRDGGVIQTLSGPH